MTPAGYVHPRPVDCRLSIVFCRDCGDGGRPEDALLLMSSDQFGALNANFIDSLKKFVVHKRCYSTNLTLTKYYDI